MRYVAICMVVGLGLGLLATTGCCFDPRPLPDTIESYPPAVKTDNPYPPLAESKKYTPEEIAPLPPLPKFEEPAPAPRAVPTPTPTLPPQVIKSLRDLARENPDILSYDEATGRLRFAADLTFDSGSNVVKPQARALLAKLAGILGTDDAKDVKADIIGFTDSDKVSKATTVALLKELKKPATNQGLSEARAESVAAILVAGNMAAGRMTTKGLGEASPVGDNKTAAGKAQNRRVEIYLSDKKFAGGGK
jgi:outer membrane protein OmpA-like peptidoglycan-associated protein